MIDFSKNKCGEIVNVFCCDSCSKNAGVISKRPADSGTSSWLCDVCRHYGIGSYTECEVGDWLNLRPVHSITSMISEEFKQPLVSCLP